MREICLLSAQGFVHESRIRAVDFLRSSGKSDCAGLVAECLRGDLKRELAFIELPRDYIRLASAWQDTPEIREACGTPDPDLRAALGRGFMLMGKGAEAAAVLEPLLENRAMGEHGLYALVAVYITSKVSDWIVGGMHYSKAAYIISRQSGDIARRILNDMDRGVTGIRAEGMYSGEKTNMLYSVVSPSEIPRLKQIVQAEDPQAFIIISDVNEVTGEGFTWDKA